jgi:hypothetical protein
MKRTKRTRYVDDTKTVVKDTADFDHPGFLDRLARGDFDFNPHKTMAGKYSPKFRSDFYRQVYYLARLGARDIDIAEFFRVTIDTVETWKVKKADFRDAWREGRWIFGMHVGETLGQRAMGYDYDEVEESEHIDRQGNKRKLVKVSHKHMPPEVNALMYILNNRFRDSWSNTTKTEIEQKFTIDITKRLDLSLLTPEEQHMIKSIAIKSVSTVQGISNT